MILHRRRIIGLVIAVALLGSTASGQEYKAQHAVTMARCRPSLAYSTGSNT